MIFGQNRQELRQMYLDAWQKSQAGQILGPLDSQIAAVITLHPEYQSILEGDATQADYTPDEGQSNPFLHMGLHLAIREQIATNRPAGITDIHQRLLEKSGDPHQAEHLMMECLAESLWKSQSQNRPPDELRFLERLRGL